jgi:hypothetical protein
MGAKFQSKNLGEWILRRGWEGILKWFLEGYDMD